MFHRIFISHPASVGESYGEHLVHALSFSVAMLFGAFACMVHALIPAMFESTGSRVIRQLNERMIINRRRVSSTQRISN